MQALAIHNSTKENAQLCAQDLLPAGTYPEVSWLLLADVIGTG